MASEEKNATGTNPESSSTSRFDNSSGSASDDLVVNGSESPEMAESSFLHGWRLRLTALG